MADFIWILLPLVFVSSTFSGVFGMAGGMMLMAGLLYFYGPVQAIFLHGIIQLFSNAQRYIHLRQHVEFKALRNYFIGAILAFSLLKFISFVPSSKAIYLMIGLGAFFAALNYRAPFRLKHRAVSFSAGVVVSSLQIVGVVGPILDIITQDEKMSRYEIIGTKSAMVMMSHFLKVVFMWQLMGIDLSLKIIGVKEIFLFLCFTYLGNLLGKSILNKLSEKFFHRCTSYILMILSILYLWRARA
jgi:uncharacterized membrane protein YfcA